MIRADYYADLYGNTIDVSSFDKEERRLVEELQQFAKTHPDAESAEFENYYTSQIGDFYAKRGLSRRDTTNTPVWQIAQDLDSRQMIAAGLARRGDYRDELEHLIRTKFRTRRAFCEATGLSEDMLSHVLAKRKNLGVQTLAEALAKVGYSIHIAPLSETS